MKIIKHCDYEKVVACECCKTVFEINNDDFIVEKIELSSYIEERNIYKVYVQCPICKTYNRVKFKYNDEVSDENRNN